MLTRRAAAQLLATTAIATGLGSLSAHAADKVVKIGVDLSLTGADSQGANRIKEGIVMAVDAANQGNAVPGYKFDLLMLDDGTATSGQYDPAQAATNARKMGRSSRPSVRR
jgi:branched-chain amino acid transport system substrate-binding protein